MNFEYKMSGRKIKYSYGVLLHRFREQDEWLVIQNRDHEAFIFFFLAWNIEKWSDSFAKYVFSGFSLDEKHRLLYYPFSYIYKDLYVNHQDGTFVEQYLRAERNFNYFHSRNDWKHLILRTSFLPSWWGFPKGRIEENETEWECAKREFEEEVGLSSTILLPTEPPDTVLEYTISKRHSSIDVYTRLFFVHLDPSINVSISYQHFPQAIRSVSVSNEVLHSRWMTTDECQHSLHPVVMKQLFHFIQNSMQKK